MFKSVIFSLGMLVVSSVTAQAVTLTYIGQNYTDIGYSNYNGKLEPISSRPFRGSYSTDMRLELTFNVDGPLLANTTYEVDYGWSYPGQNYMTSVSATDGINSFLGAVDGRLTTDEMARVVSWSFTGLIGAVSYDGDYFTSRSSNGDYAHYTYTYGAFLDQPDPLARSRLYCCESELSSASAASLGTWHGDGIVAPVPLPASAFLYLAGVAFAGGMVRRGRSS